MTAIVFDALLTTSHKLARRVLDKMRGSYNSSAYGKNVVSLSAQQVHTVGDTNLLVVQFDSSLGNLCQVGWTQGSGGSAVVVTVMVQQLLVIDAPLNDVFIKNTAPEENTSATVVAKIVSSVQ